MPGAVAVIGSGAVGLFYGAQLALAGLDVRFLLRRDYETVRRDGVRRMGGSFPLVIGADRYRGDSRRISPWR